MIPWRTELSRGLNAPRSFPDCFQANERIHGDHKWCRQWSHFSRASNQLTRLGNWRLAQRSLTHSLLIGFNPLWHALDPFTAWNSDASFFLHQKSLNSTKHRVSICKNTILLFYPFSTALICTQVQETLFSFLGPLEEYVRTLRTKSMDFSSTFYLFSDFFYQMRHCSVAWLGYNSTLA